MSVTFPTINDDLTCDERVDLLTAMIESSLDAVIAINLDGFVVEWSRAAEEMFGFTRAEAVGELLHTLIIPPEHVDRHIAGMERYRDSGSGPVLGKRIEIDAIGKSKNRFPVELAITPFLFRGDTFFVGQVRDIEGRKRYERQLLLVAKELDHRVKNTMAIMLSIARQTARMAKDVPDFLQAYESRALAYKRTHDMLAISQYKGVDLRALFLGEFNPYTTMHHTVSIMGPDVFLPPRVALTLGMCLHELTTNAVKHGSLSSDAGAVAVAWGEEDVSLVIRWTESGGPPVFYKGWKGFGYQLIQSAVINDLQGSFTLEMNATGFECVLSIPLSTVHEQIPVILSQEERSIRESPTSTIVAL